MEKVKVLGIRWVDMDAEGGRKITGYSLYICFPADNVEGLQTGKCFVPANRWGSLTYVPRVNCDVILVYNRSGKVADIQAVPHKDE